MRGTLSNTCSNPISFGSVPSSRRDRRGQRVRARAGVPDQSWWPFARLTVASICDMASSRRYWQVVLVERGGARRGPGAGMSTGLAVGLVPLMGTTPTCPTRWPAIFLNTEQMHDLWMLIPIYAAVEV